MSELDWVLTRFRAQVVAAQFCTFLCLQPPLLLNLGQATRNSLPHRRPTGHAVTGHRCPPLLSLWHGLWASILPLPPSTPLAFYAVTGHLRCHYHGHYSGFAHFLSLSLSLSFRDRLRVRVLDCEGGREAQRVRRKRESSEGDREQGRNEGPE